MASLSRELTTGDGRTLAVAEIVQTYRDIVNLSVPSQGRIKKLGDDVYSITNKFSTVDCDLLESVKTFKVYSLTTKSSGDSGKQRATCIDSVRCVSDSFGVSELALVTSENGRFTARLKAPSKQDSSSSDGNKKQLLEIWDRSRLLKTIDTSDFDAHSSINLDSVFGNMAWTTAGEQDKLVYVCQPKRAKNLSFFKAAKPSKEGESGDSSIRGEEYLKREDWGECLNGIEHTVVAVLDVSNNCQVSTIDVDDWSLATPQWLDNGTKILCVGYAEQPRRLGPIHCQNRPSKLLVFDWRSESKAALFELESDTESFHSPRVSHSGDKFIFVSNRLFGPHRNSKRLSLYDIKTKHQRSLPVDLPGFDLFIEDLPSNCFTTDDKHILFVSFDHLNYHMYLYTLETTKVAEIKFPTAGLSILDFNYDIILASGSDIDATPTLFVASLNTSNTSDVVAWHQIEECIHLDELKYEQFQIPTSDGSTFISALLVEPSLEVIQANPNEKTLQARDKLVTSSSSLPTVMISHGGPHSSFSVRHMPLLVFYARIGFKVVLINYRGSLGVTQEYVESLCGNIGQLDVEDCLQTLRYFVQKGLIDRTKLIIQGGSHSGLITCHLSCQDEFKFTSAIIVNPVVDLTSMFGTTDIPDWVSSEALDHKLHDPAWVPTSQDLVRLRECSPMFKSSQAYVPTLVLLGRNDRRVRMFQGERWADVLKARGIDVQCKIYSDEHALAKVEVMADRCISAALWALDHLPK